MLNKTGSLVKEQLLKVPVFSGVEHENLLPVLRDCEIKEFHSGQYIYRYGDYGEECGVILSGSAGIEFHQKGTKHKEDKIFLKEGEIFGEVAVLSGYTRTADVIALEPASILMIHRETLFKLFDKFPPIKNEIDRLYRQRALSSKLLTTPIFSGVSREFLEDILGKIALHSYHKGELVFRQGDDADAFYLVRYGFLKVTEAGSDGRERVLAYLKGGHYFGEMALVEEGKKRMATITAIGRTELVRVSREDFLNIIESYPRIKISLGTYIDRIKEKNIEIREDVCMERTLSAIIDLGMIQSRGILLIDTTKCIQCDNCVKACSVLHNNHSRLIKKGAKLNNIFLIATSCRHCDDPTCMIKCPTGAIARNIDGEIYHMDSCIGCGSCARSCTYGNISMVSLPETSRRLTGKHVEQGEEHSDKLGKLRKKPVKCDMCMGYHFVACVYNCPSGAARMVNPEEFFDITGVG